MSNKLKALGLAAVVAVAVMVPLYGAPRTGAVEHGEWARMLLHALDMERAVTEHSADAQLFSILSWKNSLAFKADAYLRGEGVDVVGASGARKVLATAPSAEVAYPLAVVKGGDYRFRVRMAGNPSAPASAEITALGGADATATFTLVPTPLTSWVDAGAAHLDPGAYTASILLPAGTSLDNVEVAPPCTDAIEPPGGWRSRAVTQTEEVAVTALKALDLEWELPSAEGAVEVSSGAMKWIGNLRGQQTTVFLDLPEAGLYTVSVLGAAGGGQSWKADACRKAVWCPDATVAAAPAPEPAWHVLMTAPFGAGRHFFSANLGPGASAQRLRAVRKRDGAADYVATLRRLGFDVGPAGPISRPRAVEAMHFIERRRSEMTGACGDVLAPTVERALAEAAPIAGPGTGPGFSGNAPGGERFVPVGSPVEPPPVTTPGPPPTVPNAPTPTPTPPPTIRPRPTPTPPPPPPTMPTQPEGSPILPATAN
jgi:hypothetical protein